MEELVAIAPTAGTPFRLRALIHVGTTNLAQSGQSFALQYAGLGTSTSCGAPNGTPSAFTAVNSTSTHLLWYNNSSPADGDALTASSSDPTHGADTVVDQTYEEANNFTNSVATIAAGEDGLWDFALTVSSTAPTSTPYCFRAVQSDGTPLDTYSVYPRITTTSSAPVYAPAVSNVVLNNGSAITLTENTSTSISVTATVTDGNGYADITSASATIYRMGATAACTENQSSCYRIASCTLSACSGNSCTATCTAKLQYFAESTDDYGAYTQEDWRATVAGYDSTGTSTAGTSSGVELNSLLALDVTNAVGYGSLNAGTNTGSSTSKTTVVNTGNIPIDPDISGTNMTNASYTIAPANQKFSSSTFTYSTCTGCTALATSATTTDIRLLRASSTSLWPYRMSLTIDYTKVSGTAALANFPVLVAATNTLWKHTSFSGHVGVASGTDIYFTQSDGFTKLSHEIEKYSSSTGELVAWVKVPSLSTTTNTILYMYYGNASSTDQQDRTGVWDTNFKLVQHFEETSAATTTDSTAYNNHGTSTGSGIPTATSGIVNSALSFDGSDDYVNITSSSSIDMSQGTITGWFKFNSMAGGISFAPGGGWEDERFVLHFGWPIDGKIKFTHSNGTSYPILYSTISPSNGVWYYIAATFDGSTKKLFIDGAVNNSASTAIIPVTVGVPLYIGRTLGLFPDYSSGAIDEVRISNIARSSGWIATEYNNQSAPSTFMTVGSEASNQQNWPTADVYWGLVVPTGTPPFAYTGTNTFTAVSQINVGKTWIQATSTANWSTRLAGSGVTYKDKMWIYGGDQAGKNDVWWSTNGVSWTRATSTAAWGTRGYFGTTVYNEKMWVMGGNPSYYNDVWWSTDGVSWTQATASSAWAGRNSPGVVVFDNKMWVMGGEPSSGRQNDVWWSTDGISWTQATSTANWSARTGHTVLAYNGKMWVLGGLNTASANLRDVWWSTDGVSWTQATSTANWSARYFHQSIVFNNKMWVIGGYDGNQTQDAWWSTDGVSWTQATSTAAWQKRHGYVLLNYQDSLWALAGYNGSVRLNDVWQSSP